MGLFSWGWRNSGASMAGDTVKDLVPTRKMLSVIFSDGIKALNGAIVIIGDKLFPQLSQKAVWKFNVTWGHSICGLLVYLLILLLPFVYFLNLYSRIGTRHRMQKFERAQWMQIQKAEEEEILKELEKVKEEEKMLKEAEENKKKSSVGSKKMGQGG